MESTGQPGRIHVSQAFRDKVPHEPWQATGGVEAKGKGLMQVSECWGTALFFYCIKDSLGVVDTVVEDEGPASLRCQQLGLCMLDGCDAADEHACCCGLLSSTLLGVHTPGHT